MRVIIGDSVYSMSRKAVRGVLSIASKQVSCGVYAVKKDDICELKNELFDDVDQLRQAVAKYVTEGFKVYFNG